MPQLLQALFSIPTRRRPIPNATASVFFTLDPGTRGFVKPKVKENAEDIEEDTDAPAKIRIDKTKTDVRVGRGALTAGGGATI